MHTHVLALAWTSVMTCSLCACLCCSPLCVCTYQSIYGAGQAVLVMYMPHLILFNIPDGGCRQTTYAEVWTPHNTSDMLLQSLYSLEVLTWSVVQKFNVSLVVQLFLEDNRINMTNNLTVVYASIDAGKSNRHCTNGRGSRLPGHCCY